jgi:hypothetical protein
MERGRAMLRGRPLERNGDLPARVSRPASQVSGRARESQRSVGKLLREPSRARRHTKPKSRYAKADAGGVPGAATNERSDFALRGSAMRSHSEAPQHRPASRAPTRMSTSGQRRVTFSRAPWASSKLQPLRSCGVPLPRGASGLPRSAGTNPRRARRCSCTSRPPASPSP